MGEVKKLPEKPAPLDLDIPFENDFEAGRWVRIDLVVGVSFDALIVPRVGDSFVRTIDRVRKKHGVGRGRKADFDKLDVYEQRQISREATVLANWRGYRTESGKPISIQGESCPDTEAGRMRLLSVPMINEAIETAIESETERARSLTAEEAQEAEALEGN